jgi:PAS domain S-box-containing protein
MRRTLLFVEDEAIIALVTTKELEEAGYNVVHAFTGEKALEIINKVSPPIDMVLMDIDLGGGKDGVETAEEILLHQTLPIMFFSSYSDKTIVEKIKRVPFYGFVLKSAGMPVLLASIEAAFKLYDTQVALETSRKTALNWNTLIEDIVRHDHSALGILDKDLVYLYVSDAYFDDKDLKGQEIIGRHHYNIFPNVTDAWKEIIQRALKGEVISSDEDIMVRSDGSIDHIRWQCRPWYEHGGKIGGIMIYTDYINDLVEQREKLRQKENDLQEAYWIADLGRWEILIGTHRPVWSNSIYEIFEIDKKLTGDALFSAYKEVLHPDDREWVLKTHENQAITSTNSFRVDHRLLMKDGRVKWITETCRTECNSNDTPVKLVGIVQDITNRKNHEETLERLLVEKDTLLQELRHRIKNNLQVISSLLTLEIAKHSEAVVKQALNESQARIQSMALIYERLHRSNNFIDVDLDWYLRELTRSLFETYTSPDTFLRLQTHFEKTRINSKRAIPLGLILNELVVNSVKYAYPGATQGEIRIILKNSGTIASLCVEDDGCGLPQNFDTSDSSGTGLKLVHALTKQIDGRCDISSQGGTSVAIRFSLD